MGSERKDWMAVLDDLLNEDQAALLEICHVITGYLARFGAYKLKDSWDDLCQEVLIALVRTAQRGAIRDPRALVSFIGTVTRNKLIDWVNKGRKAGHLQLKENAEEKISADESVGHRPIKPDPDILLDLFRSLETLPEKERLILEAIYYQGMTCEEAAERLGIPFGTAKRMKSQALRRLRDRIEADSDLFSSRFRPGSRPTLVGLQQRARSEGNCERDDDLS